MTLPKPSSCINEASVLGNKLAAAIVAAHGSMGNESPFVAHYAEIYSHAHTGSHEHLGKTIGEATRSVLDYLPLDACAGGTNTKQVAALVTLLDALLHNAEMESEAVNVHADCKLTDTDVDRLLSAANLGCANGNNNGSTEPKAIKFGPVAWKCLGTLCHLCRKASRPLSKETIKKPDTAQCKPA